MKGTVRNLLALRFCDLLVAFVIKVHHLLWSVFKLLNNRLTDMENFIYINNYFIWMPSSGSIRSGKRLYICCKVYFQQSLLYENVRFPQTFLNKSYVPAYFGGWGTGMRSAVLFPRRCFTYRGLDYVWICSNDHPAWGSDGGLEWNRSEFESQPRQLHWPGYWFPWISVSSLLSGDHNTYPIELLWGIYF